MKPRIAHRTTYTAKATKKHVIYGRNKIVSAREHKKVRTAKKSKKKLDSYETKEYEQRNSAKTIPK